MDSHSYREREREEIKGVSVYKDPNTNPFWSGGRRMVVVVALLFGAVAWWNLYISAHLYCASIHFGHHPSAGPAEPLHRKIDSFFSLAAGPIEFLNDDEPSVNPHVVRLTTVPRIIPPKQIQLSSTEESARLLYQNTRASLYHQPLYYISRRVHIQILFNNNSTNDIPIFPIRLCI